MAVEKIGVLDEALSVVYQMLAAKRQRHEHDYYEYEQNRKLMWNLIGNAHSLPDLETQQYQVKREEEGIVLYKITEDDEDAG